MCLQEFKYILKLLLKRKYINIFLKATYADVRLQIDQRNRQRLEEEKKEFLDAVAEREKIQNLIKKDKDFEEKKKIAALEYGKELMQQAEEIRKRKQIEKEKELENLRKSYNAQEENEKFARDLIEKNIDILPLHPQFNLMKIL